MKVAGLVQADGLLNLSELIAEEELCINLRGRVEHCTACRDACPSGAITLSVDAVDIDNDKCTGCNSCLPVCPAGALRSTGFVPERFLQALDGRESVHLHCRRSTDAGGGIVIPCHNVLDARLLAAATAEGARVVALHGLGHCADCDLGDARAHVDTVHTELEAWLGEAAPILDRDPDALAEESREYQDQPHLSRRAFLRFGGAETMVRIADWVVPGLGEEDEDEEVLPFFQADELPQRAAQYQQALVSRAEGVPWHDAAVLPWKARTLAESCSGCLSCGERCPTGALQARVESNVRQLSFDPALCTDCCLCERVCPEQAVMVGEIGSLTALFQGRSTLLCRHLSSCRQCGTPFDPVTPEEILCPVCKNEQDLDDEWMEMLSG